MVGCWHGCLAAKESLSTGSIFIYTVHWLLHASYITITCQAIDISIYFSFVTFLSLSGNFLTLQLAATSKIKGTQIQIKKEVSTCTHIHHLNMYMCDQEHM